MTYAYLIHGMPPAKVRDIDKILEPTEVDSPERVAAENRRAMAALGAVGMIRPKKKADA